MRSRSHAVTAPAPRPRAALAAGALCAAALCAAGCPPPGGDCGDGAVDGGCALDGADASSSAPDGAVSDAPSAGGGFVPYVFGGFARVFVPPGTRYLNDHTLVRGPDGTWHVYGITHESAGSPQSEHVFLHATAPELFGEWTARADILTADAMYTEQVLWAPYAFERAPGAWTMYYEPGWPDDPPRQELRRADSTNLTDWTRVVVAPGARPSGGRDPMVLREGDRWLLYSVGVDATAHGQILVTESRDLATWTSAVPVLTDPVPNFPWGNLESPFVVKYEGQFYLFVTRTGPGGADYVRTNVFRSADPTRFEFAPITDLRAHAAEIVIDGGRYFITSAGWTGSIGEDNRGLEIAPLAWAPAP